MDHPAEMLAEVGRRAEPAPLRHGLNRKVGHFEESLGLVDSLPEKPLIGGSARFGPESAGKGSGTHGGPTGETFDRHEFIKVFLYPCDRVGEQVGRGEMPAAVVR